MTWSQSATPATDRLFTGHQQMGAKSGTYYANARFYSADIGRFPTPDSWMGNVYEPQSLSRYTYVGNNPTNRIDPTGHELLDGAFCCSWMGGGGGGGGGGGSPPPGTTDPAPPPKDTQPEVRHRTCWVEWYRGPGPRSLDNVRLRLEQGFSYDGRVIRKVDDPRVTPYVAPWATYSFGAVHHAFGGASWFVSSAAWADVRFFIPTPFGNIFVETWHPFIEIRLFESGKCEHYVNREQID